MPEKESAEKVLENTDRKLHHHFLGLVTFTLSGVIIYGSAIFLGLDAFPAIFKLVNSTFNKLSSSGQALFIVPLLSMMLPLWAAIPAPPRFFTKIAIRKMLLTTQLFLYIQVSASVFLILNELFAHTETEAAFRTKITLSTPPKTLTATLETFENGAIYEYIGNLLIGMLLLSVVILLIQYFDDFTSLDIELLKLEKASTVREIGKVKESLDKEGGGETSSNELPATLKLIYKNIDPSAKPTLSIVFAALPLLLFVIIIVITQYKWSPHGWYITAILQNLIIGHLMVLYIGSHWGDISPSKERFFWVELAVYSLMILALFVSLLSVVSEMPNSAKLPLLTAVAFIVLAFIVLLIAPRIILTTLRLNLKAEPQRDNQRLRDSLRYTPPMSLQRRIVRKYLEKECHLKARVMEIDEKIQEELERVRTGEKKRRANRGGKVVPLSKRGVYTHRTPQSLPLRGIELYLHPSTNTTKKSERFHEQKIYIWPHRQLAIRVRGRKHRPSTTRGNRL
ncbi:hypothetical protein ACUIAC_03640 [Dermabacteraceae bacterium P13138]